MRMRVVTLSSISGAHATMAAGAVSLRLLHSQQLLQHLHAAALTVELFLKGGPVCSTQEHEVAHTSPGVQLVQQYACSIA
jgi:glutamate-1-semialdehyde aminotransferase